MNTLGDIEKAVDALPAKHRKGLLLLPAGWFRAKGARLPEPRSFSREKTRAWVAEDGAALAGRSQ